MHWMKNKKKNYGRLSNEGSDKVLVRRVEARGLVQKIRPLDQEMRVRFEELYWKASRGELFSWRASAQGRLAKILLFGPNPSEYFRGQPKLTYDRFACLGLGPKKANTSQNYQLYKGLFLHALYAFGIFNHS